MRNHGRALTPGLADKEQNTSNRSVPSGGPTAGYQDSQEQTSGGPASVRSQSPAPSCAPVGERSNGLPPSKPLHRSVQCSVGSSGLLSSPDSAQPSSSHVLGPSAGREGCGETPEEPPQRHGEKGVSPRGREETRESASQAMRAFRDQGWTRLADPLLVLILSDTLTAAEVRVLLVFVRAANWSPDRQHGMPATWISVTEVAKRARCDISTAQRAVSRLGSTTWREKGKSGIAVHERRPLCVLRDATEDEAAGVLEGFTARPGRPPKVRVFRHPDYWQVNALIEEEVNCLLAHPRSRIPGGGG